MKIHVTKKIEKKLSKEQVKVLNRVLQALKQVELSGHNDLNSIVKKAKEYGISKKEVINALDFMRAVGSIEITL